MIATYFNYFLFLLNHIILKYIISYYIIVFQLCHIILYPFLFYHSIFFPERLGEGRFLGANDILTYQNLACVDLLYLAYLSGFARLRLLDLTLLELTCLT